MKEKVKVDGKEVVLVGTSHVSKKSVDEVKEAIELHNPDKVCVELDERRYRTMTGEEDWEDKDISKIIKEGDGNLLFFKVLLSIYQRKLGEEYDISPGSEMLAAIEEAERQGIEFSLIDRNINITFDRARSELTFFEKMKLLYAGLESFFVQDDELNIEELEEEDVLETVINKFSDKFPVLKEVFIDERDTFMSKKIREEEGEVILAVVGAGHLKGIKENLSSPEKNEGIVEKVDKRFNAFKLLKYGVPAFVIGLFVYGFLNMGFETGIRMFNLWFFMNGILAAVGALVAKSHILTVITTFFAAPFTSINPALPAGLVASFVENSVRKPRAKDMEHLVSISSFKELWGGRATKLLLIFFLVNLGSSIATFIGAGTLARVIGLV